MEKTIASFKKNRFTVRFFAKAEEAADYLDREIDGKTVGLGDSATLETLRMYERLTVHNRVFDPCHPEPGKNVYRYGYGRYDHGCFPDFR